MGSKNSTPRYGFHRPPNWYLKNLAKNLKLSEKEIVSDCQAALLHFANHLSREEVTIFLLDHPGFLQSFVDKNVSENRVKEWLRNSVASEKQLQEVMSSQVTMDEGDDVAYVNGWRRLQQLKTLTTAKIVPNKPKIDDINWLRQALPETREKLLPDIASYAFRASTVDGDYINPFVYCMTEDILGADMFPAEKYISFLTTVRVNYGKKALCNYTHAFCHFQGTYWILKDQANLFTTAELKALLIASISHDIRDAGLSSEDMAQWIFSRLPLIKPITVKQRHNALMAVLTTGENNILEDLELGEFKKIVSIVQDCIGYTDFSTYMQSVGDLSACFSEDCDVKRPSGKAAVMRLLMILSDLAGYWKPFQEHKVLAEDIYQWFLKLAAEHHTTKAPMQSKVPRDVLKDNARFQEHMMKTLVIPLFNVGEYVFSCMRPAVKEAKKNLRRWTREVRDHDAK